MNTNPSLATTDAADGTDRKRKLLPIRGIRAIRGFLLTALLLGALGAARAGTLTVVNLNDSGPGSLRQAIADAAPGDTIDFAVTGTITLTSGELVIDRDLIIAGPGATNLTVSGNNASRVFALTNVTAAISGVTIAHGYGVHSVGAGINNVGGSLLVSNCIVDSNSMIGDLDASRGGAGIANEGALAVVNCTLSRNWSGRWGGGIYSKQGTVTVRDTTISDNSAGTIGAGICQMGGHLQVVNSSVVRNNCGDAAGGIYVSNGSLAVTNATVSGNRGYSNAGAGIRADNSTSTIIGSTVCSNACYASYNLGGGIYAPGGTMTLANTIVSGNFAPNHPDYSGTISSADFNLIGNTNGATITGVTTHNIYGKDPLLGPLANNGGPTPTHALLPGSPAIDHGSSGGLATDQRGLPRAFNFPAYFDAADGADIGAYELQERAQTGPVFTVNTTDDVDDGVPGIAHCSLREAIAAANANADTNTIDFAVEVPGLHSGVTGTITLTNGQLTITNSVNIAGPGAAHLTVSGNNASRAFHIYGAGPTVTLSGITISGGSTTGSVFAGGGVYLTSSHLSLRRCVFMNNYAHQGSAIYSAHGGTLNLSESTLYNNAGGATVWSDQCTVEVLNSAVFNNTGWGLLNASFGSMTITNTTISGNSGGNGVLDISSGPSVTMVSCTIIGNRIEGSFAMRNCILAWPTDYYPLSINSLDYNLILNTNLAVISGVTTHNIYGQDPLLGPLADNGGPTPTHALLPGSPAIDHGSSGGLATDQRGLPRPIDDPSVPNAAGGDGSDIGAYEAQLSPPVLAVSPAAWDFGTVVLGGYEERTFVVTNQGAATLSNGVATVETPFSITGGAAFELPGYGSTNVVVRFTPESAGTHSKVVVFSTANAGSVAAVVTGDAITPGQIAVTPSIWDFGFVAVGASAERTFGVTNLGGAAVAGGSVAVDAPYSIVAGSAFDLPGYGATNVVVRFTPTGAGNASSTVRFSTANGGNVTNAVVGQGALLPVANFTVSPPSGAAPLPVFFTDTSSGTITNRHWDFGDGGATNATATMFVRSYGTAGTNTVTLVVSGPLGSSTNRQVACVVVTNPPPQITVQPLSRTNVAGSSLMFNVTATGAGPLAYQWQHNAVAIPQATTRTLVLAGVTPNDAGLYRVMVSDSSGATSSSNAALTVRPLVPPGVLAGPLTNSANGHRYWLLEQSTWVEAEAAAVALGGHLATVRNETEQEWIYSTFSQFQGQQRNLGIGLYDAAPLVNAATPLERRAEFVWTSGEPVTYANWQADEPNNWQERGEFYVHLISPDGLDRAGYWNDVHDTTFNYFTALAPFNGVVEVPPALTLRLTWGPQSQVHLLLNGPVGAVCRVEYVRELGSTNWCWLSTVILDGPDTLVVDPEPATNQTRFYRAVLLPGGGVGTPALSFDGGDRVIVPNRPALNPATITVETWVNFGRLAYGNGWSPTDSQLFVVKGGETTPGCYWLAQGGSGPTNLSLAFVIGPSHSNPPWVAAAPPLQTNRWYHIAGTYDGSSMQLFLDGQMIASNHVGTAVIGNSSPLYFGFNDAWPFYLTGQMDEVRIWNYARSEAQIRAAMYATLTGNEPGLIGCWDFNEPAGSQTVRDRTPNAFDGQLGSTLGVDADDPTRFVRGPLR